MSLRIPRRSSSYPDFARDFVVCCGQPGAAVLARNGNADAKAGHSGRGVVGLRLLEGGWALRDGLRVEEVDAALAEVVEFVQPLTARISVSPERARPGRRCRNAGIAQALTVTV